MRPANRMRGFIESYFESTDQTFAGIIVSRIMQRFQGRQTGNQGRSVLFLQFSPQPGIGRYVRGENTRK